MVKKVCGMLTFLMFGYVAAEEVSNDSEDSADEQKSVVSQSLSDKIGKTINIKAAHERENEKVFGGKNTSAVGITPIFAVGDNVVIEGDVTYGRQFSYVGILKGPQRWMPIVSDPAELYANFATHGLRLNKPCDETTNNAKLYRNYTRLVYTNKSADFRAVVGDTTTRNTIGFQQALSGCGIGVFRQGGNGSVINGGSPIVVTKIAKVECRLNGQIIAVQYLKPGIYSLDDLPAEIKLPGVSVKLSDQLSRSEHFKVDFFSGYGMPEQGKSDFDLVVVFPHKWDIDNPQKLNYSNNAKFSSNYRYGHSDNLTLGVGAQIAKNSLLVDWLMIFSGKFGKISPNFGISSSRNNGKRNGAVGFGIFYSAPENPAGISFEASFSWKGKGYGDLGKGKEAVDANNEYINRCFADSVGPGMSDIRNKFLNVSLPSPTKQFVARLYSKPILGITPAFVFNGVWTKSTRLREYTLALTSKIFEKCTLSVSGGLTYDDPSKGLNLQSPDRRLQICCTVDLSPELSIEGNYCHYESQKRRSWGHILYTPEEIKGLELSAEYTRRPGFANPVFTVKYDNEFFNFKADESITNQYEDKEGATSTKHSNRQRFFFATSLSEKGIRAFKSSGYNTLRE